jgi:hypothetical protein
MKSDSSSTMTFSYDKKTQASYNNILEDRPFRTAQPKVGPALDVVDAIETSDIPSS